MIVTLFLPGEKLIPVLTKLVSTVTDRFYMVMYQISVKGEIEELLDKISERVDEIADVRFVLNYQGDNSLKRGVFQFAEKFRGKGDRVKVWITDNETAHAKMFILDNWLLLGSANLSKKAVTKNFEANLLTNDPVAVGKAVEWFQEITKYCEFVNGR